MIEIDASEIWETDTHRVVVHWRAGGDVYFHRNKKDALPTVADFHKMTVGEFNEQTKKYGVRKMFPR